MSVKVGRQSKREVSQNYTKRMLVEDHKKKQHQMSK